MSSQYPAVNPTPVGAANTNGMVRVATDRPTDYDLGPSSMERIQYTAACALHAGAEVVLVETYRPRLGDRVYDLYATF